MESYYVVTESHTFGDDKEWVEVPEKEDVLGWVQGWVKQQIKSSIYALKAEIDSSLQKKGDKADINKKLTKMSKDMTTMRKSIGSLSDHCEQDFRQIIEDSFSSQLDCFAQQIERVERLLEEAKTVLSKAEAVKSNCKKDKDDDKKSKPRCRKSKKSSENDAKTDA